jgi:hypothetical protein
MRAKIALLSLMAVVGAMLALGCSSVPGNVNAAETTPAPSTSLPFAAEKAHAAAPETTTVAAGTLIDIRLQQQVSSASARSGDEFAAVLAEPLVANGKTLAPAGAPVTGRVVAARKSGRLHDSGYLRLALASIDIDGKAVPVHSSSVFVIGGAHKKRNLALIGGGAGVGTLIGAIAGGGKGALIGGLVGTGAGTAGAYATGKKDVAFGAERHLTFRLTQSLTL